MPRKNGLIRLFDMFRIAEGLEAFRTIIFDVVRIFDSHYRWEDLENTDATEVLEVETVENRVVVTLAGEILEEEMQVCTPQETKRLIKKLLFLLLQKKYNSPGEPWGILTGIRPTKIAQRKLDEGRTPQELEKELTEEFLMEPEKAALLREITVRQRPYFLTREDMLEKVGVYIGIPFCPSICNYCTFGSYDIKKAEKRVEPYLADLEKEIRTVLAALNEKGILVDTLYIGGGTPSSLNLPQLERLFAMLKDMKCSPEMEFTFEAGRPDTLTSEKLHMLRDRGVTRISINPQILDNRILSQMGRGHTVEEFTEAWHLARQAGFPVINMDLIMGVETEEGEFRESLEKVLELSPENITLHSLAYKRKSALATDQEKIRSRGKQEQFRKTLELLKEAGYVPYYLYKQKLTVAGGENIGFAKDSHFCRYNVQMIEERETIFGFGLGASSKYVNHKDLTLENDFNPKDLYYYHDSLEDIIARKIGFIETMDKERSYGNQKTKRDQ